MSKCRRCGSDCVDDAAYCEDCLSSQPTQEKLVSHITAPSGASSFATVPTEAVDDPSAPELDFLPTNPDYTTQPDEEQAPTIPPTFDLADQTVDKLNDAARRMDAVIPREPRLRRISRLSPLQDISSEIQRANTPPHPELETAQGETDSGILDERKRARGNRDALDYSLPMPDFWPWLPDLEDEEEEGNEVDKWANYTDPLLSRQLDPAAAELIEQEDVRRAIAEGHILPFPAVSLSHPFFKNKRLLRFFFILAAVLILISLTFDSLLVSFSLLSAHNNQQGEDNIPTLSLSTPIATYGQSITLHIRDFRAHSRLYLTHDIGEPIRANAGRSLLTLGDAGETDITVNIDENWEPGFHLLQAEDVDTRYIASTTLHVTEGPSRPSHFLLSTKQIDMGNSYQGANTLQPLTLHNSGNGNIDWSVSSDQPWLQVTPTQGTFSNQQTIIVGAQRADLKPGSYSGTLTFSSNVGAAQTVKVEMDVRELPTYAGAVLQVTPVVRSYDSMDGSSNGSSQALMVTNPGTQPLYWSLAGNQPVNSEQNAYLRELDPNFNWLQTSQTSGVVAPHSSSTVPLRIDSGKLLPGTYLNTLSFNISQGHTGLNSPQRVAVSLTVKPQCMLTTNTAFMDFVAVAGVDHSSTQTLLLKSGDSCPSNLSWQASTPAKWITVTPNSGLLNGTSGATTAIGVNTNRLKPGSYKDIVSIVAGHNTLSLPVKLTVQARPTPMSPVLGASPLNLNFSTTQGKDAPAGQSVTLTNTGKSPLKWRTNLSALDSSWLGVSPTGGTIPPGQTGQVIINVDPGKLSPGSYVGQVIINGTDSKNHPAAGTPQTITVNLTVMPPCTLVQPSSSALAFSAIKGASNPIAQSITLSAGGNCSWPLTWKANTVGSAPWLILSSSSGTFSSSSQSTTLDVSASIAGLNPGVYTAQVNLQASESTQTEAQGSPQTITVTLTVQPPCTLQVSPGSLSFSGIQGQALSSQNLSLQTQGTCVRPVNWTASVDKASTGWLSTGGNGSDNGSGSNLAVSASTGSLPPGTYKGTVTITASGNGGANVEGSPISIPVTLTITGYKVSGTVSACADSQCTTPTALPNVAVTISANGSAIATTTTDSSGNFSFSNIPIGSYTIAISGTDAQGIIRSGSTQITVNGDTANVVVKAPAATPPPVSETPIHTPPPGTPESNPSATAAPSSPAQPPRRHRHR